MAEYESQHHVLISAVEKEKVEVKQFPFKHMMQNVNASLMLTSS